MMYVNQIIMLYTLNLYSAVCQLHLNKTRRKKETKLMRLPDGVDTYKERKGQNQG